MRASVLLFVLPVFKSTWAAAGPTKDSLAACNALYKQYPSNFAWDPLGPNGLKTFANGSLYHTTNTDYWNGANANNRAACAFYPANAQQVSDAVKVLNNYSSVPYALKSGGHNPNFGFSSVDQGIIISFRPNLASTTVSADRLTADVGPGSRWDEAAAVVDKYGKTVIGGRLGHVGVGGYVLGGGLSFLTSQYVSGCHLLADTPNTNTSKGFACDNIEEYELVLADGTITRANSKSNTDLFYALKGGGNQFGIVTNFKMKLHSIGQVWGGTKIYSGDKYAELMGATTNFTTNYPDPKAAVIVTFDYTLASLASIVVMFYFYDGPTPPPGVFDQFDAIKPLTAQVSTQSYPSLLTQNNQFSLSGLRYQIREATYPVMPYKQNTEFLEYHYKQFKSFTFGQALQNLDVQVVSFAIQPIPVVLQAASQAAGGNRLGLNPANGDRIFMEYDISWVDPLYDNRNPLVLEGIVNKVKDYQAKTYAGVKPTHYKSGDLAFLSSNPIFMNDGMFDQQVLQSYGAATYQKMKQVQISRDPNGFFSKRQGGFKFST